MKTRSRAKLDGDGGGLAQENVLPVGGIGTLRASARVKATAANMKESAIRSFGTVLSDKTGSNKANRNALEPVNVGRVAGKAVLQKTDLKTSLTKRGGVKQPSTFMAKEKLKSALESSEVGNVQENQSGPRTLHKEANVGKETDLKDLVQKANASKEKYQEMSLPRPTSAPTKPLIKSSGQPHSIPSNASRTKFDDTPLNDKENIPPPDTLNGSRVQSGRRSTSTPRVPFSEITLQRDDELIDDADALSEHTKSPSSRIGSAYKHHRGLSQAPRTADTAVTRISRGVMESPRLSPLFGSRRTETGFSSPIVGRVSVGSFDLGAGRRSLAGLESDGRRVVVETESFGGSFDGAVRGLGWSELKKVGTEIKPRHPLGGLESQDLKDEDSESTTASLPSDDPFGFMEAERIIEKRRLCEKTSSPPVFAKTTLKSSINTSASTSTKPKPEPILTKSPTTDSNATSSSPTLAPGQAPELEKERAPLRSMVQNIRAAAIRRTRAVRRKQTRESDEDENKSESESEESEEEKPVRVRRGIKRIRREEKNEEVDFGDVVDEEYLKQVEERRRYFQEIDEYELEEGVIE
ncbi:hypothetical protein HDU67_008859 [Dinochytrium kinnereticum]|nr:hypothetical protein HDU67_008859 [Dinochytrium kinnereticum]